MPVSDLLASGVSNLTNQQIADFMLDADRAARDAQRRGDFKREQELRREVERLASAMH